MKKSMKKNMAIFGLSLTSKFQGLACQGPIIREVVHEYLSCDDLKNGFARVHSNDCSTEYLLAFFCKSRWFWHDRKNQLHMKKQSQHFFSIGTGMSQL